MKTKHFLIAAYIFAAPFFLTSCGETMKSAELAKTLKTSNTYDGKQVEFVGTTSLFHDLRLADDSTLPIGFTVGMGTDIEVIGFPLHFGKTKNSIFINTKPDGTFESSDVTLYDLSGKTISPSSKIKVKGTVHYTVGNSKNASKSINQFSYTLSDISIEAYK
jgi:hypothetical protein